MKSTATPRFWRLFKECPPKFKNMREGHTKSGGPTLNILRYISNGSPERGIAFQSALVPTIVPLDGNKRMAESSGSGLGLMPTMITCSGEMKGKKTPHHPLW